MSRTSQSIKNIIAGVGSQILLAVITFLTTRLIKFNLGFEYLGLNGVFGNIMLFLGLSELGIGSAITFSLYKPLAEKNTGLVTTIMCFYKNAYRIVALVVFSIGMLLMPFLSFFVRTTLPMSYVRFVFLLFVVNSASSYLLSYKRNLIFADQKNYIITLYTLCFSTFMRVMQLVSIGLTNSYVVYLLVTIFSNLMLNFAISIKADKLYPYIKEKNPDKLPSEMKQVLVEKIKALFFHSIGGFLILGTDNILISYFCGVAVVGIYGSYMLLITTIERIVANIYDGINSSVGNFLVEKEVDEKYVLFEKIELANSIIIIFISVCFSVLLNPFVNLWLGEDAILHQYIIYLIVLNKFSSLIGLAPSTVKNVAGLFEQDKYAPLIESAINLISSCVLAHYIGLPGIIIGTIISNVSVSLWVQPVVVFKYVFKRKPTKYFLRIIRNFVYMVIITAIVQFIVGNIFLLNNFLTFVVISVVTIIVTICLLILFFIRDKYFSFFKNLLLNFLYRKKR